MSIKFAGSIATTGVLPFAPVADAAIRIALGIRRRQQILKRFVIAQEKNGVTVCRIGERHGHRLFPVDHVLGGNPAIGRADRGAPNLNPILSARILAGIDVQNAEWLQVSGICRAGGGSELCGGPRQDALIKSLLALHQQRLFLRKRSAGVGEHQ
jgi:hypothetical protein